MGNDSSKPVRPRKPERANGRLRYGLLLDAAERLIQREGQEILTIQRLSRESGVPTASAYHFFPSPAAVSVGLSERYMDGFREVLGALIEGLDSMPWQEIIAVLTSRAVAYYAAHPYAQHLLLGSEHVWHIRAADRENNRLIAGAIAEMLTPSFPGASPEDLLQAVVVGVTLNDAILTQAIFDNGKITADDGHEAWLAICGYLSAKFGGGDPPSD